MFKDELEKTYKAHLTTQSQNAYHQLTILMLMPFTFCMYQRSWSGFLKRWLFLYGSLIRSSSNDVCMLWYSLGVSGSSISRSICSSSNMSPKSAVPQWLLIWLVHRRLDFIAAFDWEADFYFVGLKG
jgi:hypothetical protein